MHQTKIHRALRSAAIGQFPASAEAMLEHVPACVVARLTGSELGELLDALWTCANRSKALHAAEVIAEGAVWDTRREAFREIAA
jgi:hypothetical protein